MYNSNYFRGYTKAPFSLWSHYNFWFMTLYTKCRIRSTDRFTIPASSLSSSFVASESVSSSIKWKDNHSTYLKAMVRLKYVMYVKCLVQWLACSTCSVVQCDSVTLDSAWLLSFFLAAYPSLGTQRCLESGDTALGGS